MTETPEKWLFHCMAHPMRGGFSEVWIVAPCFTSAMRKAVGMLEVLPSTGGEVTIKQVVGVEHLYEVD